jgi:hypothetical protein
VRVREQIGSPEHVAIGLSERSLVAIGRSLPGYALAIDSNVRSITG